MLAACKKGKTNAIGTRSARCLWTGLIRRVDSSTGALKVDMLIQAYRQLGNGEYMKLDSMILRVSVPSESNADVGGRFMASLVGQ